MVLIRWGHGSSRDSETSHACLEAGRFRFSGSRAHANLVGHHQRAHLRLNRHRPWFKDPIAIFGPGVADFEGIFATATSGHEDSSGMLLMSCKTFQNLPAPLPFFASDKGPIHQHLLGSKLVYIPRGMYPRKPALRACGLGRCDMKLAVFQQATAEHLCVSLYHRPG